METSYERQLATAHRERMGRLGWPAAKRQFLWPKTKTPTAPPPQPVLAPPVPDDLLPSEPPEPPADLLPATRVRSMLVYVAKRHGITVAALRGESRRKPLVTIRQMTMTLCKDAFALSLLAIARRFNRDHTTVMHAVRATRARAERDAVFASYYAALLADIKRRWGMP